MGMRKRIKEIKNWCPQQPDRLPTKLKTYSTPIVVVLATTLIFGISFTLLSSQFAINQPISKVPLIETPVENFTQPSPSPSPTPIIIPTKVFTNKGTSYRHCHALYQPICKRKQ